MVSVSTSTHSQLQRLFCVGVLAQCHAGCCVSGWFPSGALPTQWHDLGMHSTNVGVSTFPLVGRGIQQHPHKKGHTWHEARLHVLNSATTPKDTQTHNHTHTSTAKRFYPTRFQSKNGCAVPLAAGDASAALLADRFWGGFFPGIVLPHTTRQENRYCEEPNRTEPNRTEQNRTELNRYCYGATPYLSTSLCSCDVCNTCHGPLLISRWH